MSTTKHWLKRRAKEPSTYTGLIALASAVGISFNVQMAHELLAAALTITGLYDSTRSEQSPE